MPDSTSTLPDERALQRAMSVNIVAGSLGMFWAAVAFGMPLPLFMEAIRASGQQLGLLGGLRQLSMLAQLPVAFVVERMSARKPFWATVLILQRSLWGLPGLLPFVWPDRPDLIVITTIAMLAVAEVMGNLGNAPWMSWMADLLPPSQSGRFWGRRQRVLSLALVVASGLFGIILDQFPSQAGLIGFTIVFGIAGIAGVVDIIIHLFVHEPAPVPHPQDTPVLRRLVQPLRDPCFRRLTWALGAWNCAVAMPGITHGVPGFFNVIYLKEAFGASYSQASILIIASAIGGVLFTSWIGHQMDLYGARKTALRLMILGPLATLSWFFVSPARLDISLPFLGHTSMPWAALLMGFASLFIGGFYMGMLLCQIRLTQAHTPPEGRTVSMALHWALVGLIAFFGPLVAGVIKDHFPAAWGQFTLPFGVPFSYFQAIILLHLAVIWLVARPLLKTVREEV